MTVPAWARILGGAAIVAGVVWWLGVGPFLAGLRTINGWSLAVAAGIALVTTVCSAWRWTLVARGLGVGVPLHRATAAYYRSQFLNTVLPGGVVGDVHRAVAHGRDVGKLARSVRSVGWERLAGQVVQLVFALTVLLAVPSPLPAWAPAAVALLAVVAIAVLVRTRLRRTRQLGGRPVASGALPPAWSSRWTKTVRAAATDISNGLLARDAWPGIALASVVVVAGHTATFLFAARTAGVTAPLIQLLPLTMLTMLAMAVPVNIGGWGPREGVAAWVFGAAGLGAGQGVAVAAVYGVMVLVATLPGAVVLVAGWFSGVRTRRQRTAGPHIPDLPEVATAASLESMPVPARSGGSANG